MNTRLFGQLLLAGALVAGAASVSHATTLDFTVFPGGLRGATVLHLSQATVTSLGDDFYIGSAYMGSDGLAYPVPNAVCAVNFDSHSYGNCDTDFKITFIGDVSNLSFNTFGFVPGDFTRVTAYNSANIAIGTFDITDDGTYGFDSLSGIRWVYFDDSSTQFGGFYANIAFNEETGTVAEPATLGMMAAGLALLAAMCRRRRQERVQVLRFPHVFHAGTPS